jgi:hypothetical protein
MRRTTVYRLFVLAMFLLPLGCSDGSEDSAKSNSESEADDAAGISLDDDDQEPADEDGDGWDGCDVLALEINGEAPEDTPDPSVDDEWVVFLLCDGVKLQGANRLYFEPPELATVQDVNTIATFLEAGVGAMTMQSGNSRLSIGIRVLE